MADIFIGYASEDRSKVKPLANALKAQGWSVWWDWKSIPVGKTWRQAIEEGLESARSILVLWSSKSIGKDWVIDIAEFGKERKNLVPVLIDDLRLPIGLRQNQAARLIEWDGEISHTGFVRIIQALTSILGSPEPKNAKELIELAEQELSEPTETFRNSIGMKFVLIPAGRFMMGSEDYNYEKPQHEVTISQPFYLQTTQVTQGQWQKVIGKNPSEFKDCGDNCPVEQVSWGDAQDFIKKLKEMEGDDNYRLSTEAEWEYSVRAGTTTEFFFGDDAGKLGEYAWYWENSDQKTHPVGQKKSNPWDLYDMYGNVFEWLEDDWHDNYRNAPSDGRAWIDNPRGSSRVLRGGSWYFDALGCRSVFRSYGGPGYRDYDVGFRLARSVALDS